METSPDLYCANHPQIPTTLRCNRCEKPICTRCAVLTPTGYRCKECVKGQQKIFDTTQWYDYPLTFVVITVLSFLGSLLTGIMGFFTIFIAPIAGLIIAETARFVVQRRRSRRLWQVAALAAALGSAPVILSNLFGAASMISFIGLRGASGLFGLIWSAVYAFMVTSTVYYRLGGINIR